MTVNMDKTKYIIFHLEGKNIPNNIEIIVNNNNNQHTAQNLNNIHVMERVFTQNPNLYSRSFKLPNVFLAENLYLMCIIILRNTFSSALFFFSKELFTRKSPFNLELCPVSLPSSKLSYVKFCGHNWYCKNVCHANECDLNLLLTPSHSSKTFKFNPFVRY
jgi:hypothetical protein